MTPEVKLSWDRLMRAARLLRKAAYGISYTPTGEALDALTKGQDAVTAAITGVQTARKQRAECQT